MVKNIADYIKLNLWTGMSVYERAFLFSTVLLQIIVFIFSPDTPLGIIAGIAGCISVVLCAKGRIAFYFIGFVQNFSYMLLAFQNQFYGEVLENVFYVVTMIWGIIVWKKTSIINEDGTDSVAARKFTLTEWVFSITGTVVCTIALGYWLTTINSQQAYTDAATNVMAIFAQIMMVKCYREQWIWWLLIDVFCIKMWFVAGNWSMVAMYIAWTINCIYGWINWTKLQKAREAATKEGL